MASSRRYRLDSSVQCHGTVVIGGSPLKLFRLTNAGAAMVDRLAKREAVPSSKLTTALLDAGAIHPTPDAGRFTTDDVTVVVPTLGVPTHSPADAIVVDDGSQRPVPGSRLRLDTNQGPAAARNAGLELVTTELVAFVDADVELPDGWLDPLLPHFDDDRVALVAPRVRTRPSDTVLGHYERDESPLDLGAEPARITAGSRVSYVPAAAVVCRVAAIRGIAGFDTDLRFGEDVDLVWRLGKAGWTCRYEPAGEVEHELRSGLRSWVRQRIGYGSSAAALAKRHPGALAPVRMSGWSVACWLFGATGRPIVGSVIGAGSAAALIRKLPDIPPMAAVKLAGLGNVHAGNQLAAAVRRVWWPLLAVAAWRSKSARRVLVMSMLAVRHPLRAVDDVAYSLGVWQGMWTERTLDPLVPEISSWPGRSTPGPSAAGR